MYFAQMCVICICMHVLIGTWMCRCVHMCVETRGWHLASSLSPLIEPTYLASLGSRFAPGSLCLLLPTAEITGGFHIHLALPCMLETQMPVLMLAANNLFTGTVLHRHTPFCVNVSRRGSWGREDNFQGLVLCLHQVGSERELRGSGSDVRVLTRWALPTSFSWRVIRWLALFRHAVPRQCSTPSQTRKHATRDPESKSLEQKWWQSVCGL